jgi:hypothetical protein
MATLKQICLANLKLTVTVASVCLMTGFPACEALDGSVRRFESNVSVNLQRSDQIDYGIDLPNARYFVYVPSNYTGRQPFGLVVYTSPIARFETLPPLWSTVLEKYGLFFIAPQDAGNNSNQKHRLGLSVLGALAMQHQYRIDPSRIYAAGLSGGARTASDLAFLQPDLFSGTIQSCGSDFYHAVAHRFSNNWTDTNGNPYGVVEVPSGSVAIAKSRVRFALITGPNDFRHGNIADIYNSGFSQEGFTAKLFDVPGMGHQDCDAQTLDQALNFISTQAGRR